MLSDIVPEATTADDESVPAEKKDSKGSALWREIKGLVWVLHDAPSTTRLRRAVPLPVAGRS